MKYTTEYCRNNKVAIKYNSREEFIKICNYFDSNLIKFFESNQECVRFCPYAGNSIGFSSVIFYKEEKFKIITFQQFMQSQIKRLEDFTDKDVIHCPTEELANKICKLLHHKGFIWRSKITYTSHNNWETYQKDTCYKVKQGEFSSKGFYEKQGYTIHKAEDILALYETDLSEDKLPEEYIVECNTKEESQIAINFIKDKPFKLDNHWKYAINSKNKAEDGVIYDHILTKFSHFPILTFKEFQQKIMKEAKIIGYKCPISLFNGEVEKDTLFVKMSDTMYEAQSSIKEVRTMKFLPKEIVETWVAVLEDEFKVGDWIYIEDIGSSVSHELKVTGKEHNGAKIGDVVQIQGSTNQGGYSSDEDLRYYGKNWNLRKEGFRKATQAEIDSLFNKILTLSNGKEVIVNKGTIKPEGVEEIDAEELTNLIKNWVFKVNGYTTTVVDITFNIGCWKNVKLIDIQNILLEVERQKELMKD